MEKMMKYIHIIVVAIAVTTFALGFLLCLHLYNQSLEPEKSSCTILRDKHTITAVGTKKYPMTKELCDSWEGVYKAGTGEGDVDY